MLRTKITVYSVILSFLAQPVSLIQADDVKMGNPNSTPGGFYQFDEKALAQGVRDGKPMDLDAQFELFMAYAKKVAGSCGEFEGKAAGVKESGQDLYFTDSNGKKIGNQEAVNRLASAYTSDVGIKSVARPLNCEEAWALYAVAEGNYKERLARAASDEKQQKVQATILADSSKGVGCVDCGTTESAAARAPGSDLAALSDVAKKAGEDGFNIDAAIAGGGTTTACVASQDSKSNIGHAITKVGSCTSEYFGSFFDKAPKDKGVNGFIDALTNGGGLTGCIGDMMGAAIKGLWTSLKALFVDLPVLAYEGAKAGIKKIGNWMGLTKAEDAVADKQHEIGKTSESEVSKFKKDPINYIIRGLKNVVNFFLGEVTSELGCNKWSGVRFASTCEEPWNGWSCATCNQVRSMVCGGIGVVTSTVLASGAMGMAFRGVAKGAKGIFKTLKPSDAKKLAESVDKNRPRFSVAQNVQPKKAGVFARSKSAAGRAAKSVAQTPVVAKSLSKLGQKWAQYQASAFGKTMSRLGKGAQSAVVASWNLGGKALSATGKGISKVTDFDKWPNSLVLKPVTVPGKLVQDYFYAVNRAFEGRLVHPFRVRSARLYDKAAREALKAETAAATGVAGATQAVERLYAKDIADHLDTALQVAPAGDEAANILMNQAKRMGTDQYVAGVRGMEKMDELNTALKSAKTTAEKDAVYTRVYEMVESDAVKAAFPQSTARGALARDIVTDLKAGKVPASSGDEIVDAYLEHVGAMKTNVAQLETKLKNAKSSAERAVVEGEIRNFTESAKNHYINRTVAGAMSGDAAQAAAVTAKMSDLGFYLDPVNPAAGTYKFVHPKETLKAFSDDLNEFMSGSGLINRTLGRGEKAYSASGGVIRVKNPGADAIKKAGFKSQDELYQAMEKHAKSMGLRADRTADGITFRPKQGTLSAYDSAEKSMVKQMKTMGYEFDPKTRMLTPKAVDPADAMATGRSGYEGVDNIVAEVPKDGDVVSVVSKNAEDSGLAVKKAADETTEVSLGKAAKDCNVKGGSGPFRNISGG